MKEVIQGRSILWWYNFMLHLSDLETTTEEITAIQMWPNAMHIRVKRRTETEFAIGKTKCLTTEHLPK